MVHRILSASLVFSPKELKHFLRFQRQELRLHAREVGTLPLASEYYDFLTWRETLRTKRRQSSFDPFSLADELSAHLSIITCQAQESPHNQTVAQGCKHLLHPATSTPSPAKCPVCTVTEHIQYLKDLTTALEEAGGPCRRYQGRDGYQENVLEGWYSAKLACVRMAQQVEEDAMRELQWSLQNRGVSLIGETMTATQALDDYWAQIEYASAPEKIGGSKESGEVTRVTFAEETNFNPGRIQSYFWRKSPRYEPGKYAVDIDNALEEVEDGGETDQIPISLEVIVRQFAQQLTENSSDESISNGSSVTVSSDEEDEDDTDETSWDGENVGERSADADCELGFIVFEDN